MRALELVWGQLNVPRVVCFCERRWRDGWGKEVGIGAGKVKYGT
jgi:hypothetical protein